MPIIKKVTPALVEFDPPLDGPRPLRSLKPEKFGVTDKAIGLVPGNVFTKGVPSNYITEFSRDLIPDTGLFPAIDQNPYNFVALADKSPWSRALRENDFHPHDTFQELSGVIHFTAKARTPCFVPAGFPFSVDDKKPDGIKYKTDELRNLERPFCQMHDAQQELRYAIPGASFKGALRSAVEAIANARFGVADQKKLGTAHLYRRRVFGVGVVDSYTPTGDWLIQEVEFPESGSGTHPYDNRAGLLAQFRPGRDPVRRGNLGTRTFTLPKSLADQYGKFVAQNPHYEKHQQAEDDKLPHEKFYVPLPSQWRSDLAQLQPKQVLYFTYDPNTRVVTNFGKNLNYLWPASRSIKDLAGAYFPRKVPKLDLQTDLAEYLFGFVGGDEKGPEGQPLGESFRGHLRFETLWGPRTVEQPTSRLHLAPLTSPSAQGKSRPLYLAPGPDGKSSSFDDPGCEIRGRKFYWHQNYQGGQKIWPKHTFAGAQPADPAFRELVRSQCPPPLDALPADTPFTGNIHFSNLSPGDLGALLFALEGDGSFDHAFHLGKAKSRGLGSFQIRVEKITAHRMADRYATLTETKGLVDLTPKKPHVLAAFRIWVAAKSRKPPETSLAAHPHLRDYIQLHTWPAKNSIRYYPINFNQYSWLPADNDERGEPRGAQRRGDPKARPPAMKRARDLQP